MAAGPAAKTARNTPNLKPGNTRIPVNHLEKDTAIVTNFILRNHYPIFQPIKIKKFFSLQKSPKMGHGRPPPSLSLSASFQDALFQTAANPAVFSFTCSKRIFDKKTGNGFPSEPKQAFT
ncbi:MAG: hypothetical protein NC211_01130 [Alistipes senegalensis]|nr:hypothetical protein [Oxalobacter formigenes]MCM1280429.1 hypothetical protein [Alistipes senegalensis]